MSPAAKRDRDFSFQPGTLVKLNVYDAVLWETPTDDNTEEVMTLYRSDVLLVICLAPKSRYAFVLTHKGGLGYVNTNSISCVS